MVDLAASDGCKNGPSVEAPLAAYARIGAAIPCYPSITVSGTVPFTRKMAMTPGHRITMLEISMRADIAWAAGLFEGEGSFIVAHGRTYPRAVVIMTDEDVIRRFGAVVGLGNIRGPYTRKGQPANKWKPFWTRSVNGFEKTQAIYAMFWPWLGARRRQRGKELLSAYVPPWHRNRH